MKAISVLFLTAVLLAVPAVSASDSGTYADRMDANASELCVEIAEALSSGGEESTVFVKYDTAVPMLFADIESVKSYAESMVRDALAFCYLTNPYPIWIWDFPKWDNLSTYTGLSYETATVTVEGKDWYTLSGVSFSLSAPEDYEDVGGTTEKVDNATVLYDGEEYEIVSQINSLLADVTVSSEAGSTVYDALVVGEATSLGVACAFTYLCAVNGVESVTVSGSVLNSDGEMEEGYWNLTRITDDWYATDCTWNSSSDNCLLVGVTTTVMLGTASYGFGATHYADSGVFDSALVPPRIASDKYDTEDENPLTTYGGYVILALMAVIIIAVLYKAIGA